MSETPRTDEYLHRKKENGHTVIVSSDFARQLEKELAEAQAEIERLKIYLATESMRADGITIANDALESNISERDELVEHMRRALEYALTEVWSTECERLIKAALSAAERGDFEARQGEEVIMDERVKYKIEDIPLYSELADDLKSILERLEGSKNDDEGERVLNDLLRVLGDLTTFTGKRKRSWLRRN